MSSLRAPVAILPSSASLVFRSALRFDLNPRRWLEVKQRAADLVRGQRLVERFGAQDVGVERGKQLGLVGIGRHQAVLDQRIQERRPAPDIPIPPPPRRPCIAAIDRERGARLRIASFGKDADADIDDPVGLAAWSLGQSPADAVRADVEPKLPAHAAGPDHRQ